jgi:hypothetical protein
MSAKRHGQHISLILENYYDAVHAVRPRLQDAVSYTVPVPPKWSELSMVLGLLVLTRYARHVNINALIQGTIVDCTDEIEHNYSAFTLTCVFCEVLTAVRTKVLTSRSL